MGTDATALLQDVEAAIHAERLILPSPPDQLLTIRRLLDDPDADVNRIAAAIGQDPALAAKILKVTNSAALAGDRTIDSLPQAVARLGNRLVGTLVTSHALLQAFGQTCPQYAALLAEIRATSREAAAWAWALARTRRAAPAEEAMLAGLVHRIGMLPILQCVMHPGHPPPSDALRPLLQNHHPRIGALLLEQWHFPAPLVTAVAAQHRPPPAARADLTDVLAVAVALAEGADPDPGAVARLALDEAITQMADLQAEREKGLEMLD